MSSTGPSTPAGKAIATIHDPLAEQVVAEIRSGMMVGLGTGRTAERAMRVLAHRVQYAGLKVDLVATSERSDAFARELGLVVRDFSLVEHVDLLFDGADEVDPHLRILKGSGGAVTRERLVAAASDRNIYMVQEHKVVERLGANTALAIAIIPFGLASIRAELRHLGLNGVVRRTLDGQLFITDNGNLILDCSIGDQEAQRLAESLNAIAGVVDHGLFITEAHEVFVEMKSGAIEQIIRCDDDSASA